jgi:hypothetical protein
MHPSILSYFLSALGSPLYYKPAESCNLDKNFGTEGSRESKEGRTILFFSASSAASCKVF